MASPILERIRNADNLPSLPAVAVEVLQLTSDHDVSLEEVAAAVRNDPALAAKILRVVNSSLFGLRREVASLRQAMILLGLRTIKVMALSVSLVDALATENDGEFDYQGFWRRSLSCAAGARLLANAAAPHLAEEAFVAGLLTDLGMLAAFRCAPDLYVSVLHETRRTGRPIQEVEQALLGVTHAEMGQAVLREWRLPEILSQAVGGHHKANVPGSGAEGESLAALVRSAATIAALFCNELPSGRLEEVIGQCREWTGLDREAVETVLVALTDHVQEAASLLSLKIGRTIDYAQIQADAAAQLAQLSMQAEQERLMSTQQAEEARLELQRLHREKEAILEVASTDGLTGIANRAAFDQRLAEEFEQARVNGHDLSLILMDVDHFKRFNDAYGHLAGDQVLRAVAECVRAVALRAGFVARYGGEEFAILVARETAEQVRALAEQIRKAVASTAVDHEGRPLRVTASFGVACPARGRSFLTPRQLIRAADQHLYRAKRRGRNRVEPA